MKIVDLFLENETVYKELKEKGGDRVFNCALQNVNAGLRNEIEHRLRSKGIIRKLPIPPEANSETNPQANPEVNPEDESKANPEVNHGNNGENGEEKGGKGKEKNRKKPGKFQRDSPEDRQGITGLGR